MARTASEPGFEDFVRARAAALTRVAYLLTGDHATADDLAQSALASAYARWDRISAMDAPEAYVRRMIVNLHVSWWRKRGRHEETRGVLPESVVADDADAYANRSLILAAVRALPTRQRAAVVLRFYEQMSDDEIAETLGCTSSTVRSQIHRALGAIRASGLLSEVAGVGSER